MKRLTTIIVVFLLAFASLTQAQQGMVLGGVLSFDQDRVEQAKGVDFALIAYGNTTGRDADLIGFHDAVNGFYPVVPQGTWLKAIVDPTGFSRMEGVDYDPYGNLDLKSKDWFPCEGTNSGGYGVMIDTSNLLGPISFRFRIRHRDGKDKLNFLIFTATWIRGGNLFTRFRVTIQKEPQELRSLRGEDRLPYLRGFIPATARAEGQATQQQTIIPAQTATQTVKPDVQQKIELPVRPNPQSEDQAEDYASPTVGSWQTTTNGDKLKFQLGSLSRTEKELVDASRSNPQPPAVTEIRLNQKWLQTFVTVTDSRPFTATIVLNGKEYELTTQRQGAEYVLVVWGTTKKFVGSILQIVDSQKRLRTISFVSEEGEN